DEFPDVVGNTLVGIVRRVAKQLHAIVIGAAKPAVQISLRQPAPPADLKPLIEVELIYGQQDIDGRKHAKIAELIDERIPVLVLQRVVKGVVPGIEQHIDPDDRQFDRDHGGQQDAAGPTVFGIEIRAGNSPHDGERRKYASHWGGLL